MLGGTGSGVFCLASLRVIFVSKVLVLAELSLPSEFVNFVTFSCFLNLALLFLNQTCKINFKQICFHPQYVQCFEIFLSYLSQGN